MPRLGALRVNAATAAARTAPPPCSTEDCPLCFRRRCWGSSFYTRPAASPDLSLVPEFGSLHCVRHCGPLLIILSESDDVSRIRVIFLMCGVWITLSDCSNLEFGMR